ncbi:hypothetical protein [Actinomadura sp. HBU206391]|uniref:hypothetical protein n=1 Tax=Actinomadura sp. HBU206391 TaxID=2731692 RepID=UPI00164FE400|nr:hypothetical protein [Actinomadura sp. HBU206391]MBC6460951.1 hypothetical protein [Actinomadura sp. HBU206391]
MPTLSKKVVVTHWPAAIARHRVFAVVVVLAAVLRAVTMLGYRPGRVYWYDSYTYLDLALNLRPREELQPSGYPFLLWLLRPFHSIESVVAAQHALGLATGLMIYAVLCRRGVPRWAATLATVPVLLDGQMLQLEQAVLSDTLFIFLVVAAVVTLIWSPRLSVRAGAAGGALLALATLTRTIALPLLGLALLYLAARRVGRRRLAVAAGAGLLPLVLYAGWYDMEYGRFTLVSGDGVALWARTMTFADCAQIKPPPAEAALCPNGSWQDAASEYVWAPDSPINRMPGGRANGDLARSFAVRAVLAQPLDYAGSVAHDVSLAFHWTPARHPKRVTPAFGFAKGRLEPVGVPAYALHVLDAYAPGATGTYRSVEPYSGFLRAYQYPAYLRGPFLAAILGLGALGLRRGSLVPWGAATALLVLPVAVLDFDHRYVLPVVPLACVAAALSLRRPSEAPSVPRAGDPVRPSHAGLGAISSRS